ncbi:MAG: Hsp20/alpha crystallin family protein [Syntrophales bacterium]|jgi:HSP20 family protein|nr:Hsp20/alpha crystallin family protein [Syntrophales bacterium]MDY0044199.1 Hsp20/alpha crystallin family protein [Syntrophales bacterium]
MADREKDLEVKKEHTLSETENLRNRPVFIPQVDIVEDNDMLLLTADMPGVDTRGIDINLENDVLTIKGTVEAPLRKNYRLIHAEYNMGDYRRSFTLTDVIDHKKIEASAKNGVLRLKLPKAEKAKPKKISVKAE